MNNEMNGVSRRNYSSIKASVVSSEGVTNRVLIVDDDLLALVDHHLVRDKLEITDHDGSRLPRRRWAGMKIRRTNTRSTRSTGCEYQST